MYIPVNRKDILNRFFAWRLARGNGKYEKQILPIKQKLFKNLSGTVVELGPGTGANISYIANNIRWIGIEPNEYMHRYLHKKLAHHFIHMPKVYQTRAETIPLKNESVNFVISTLVMCSVQNYQTVFQEIQRILKPKGRWYFIEHIKAPVGSFLSITQKTVSPLWNMMADRCNPYNNFEDEVSYAGFSKIVVTTISVDVPVISPHLVGYVVK